MHYPRLLPFNYFLNYLMLVFSSLSLDSKEYTEILRCYFGRWKHKDFLHCRMLREYLEKSFSVTERKILKTNTVLHYWEILNECPNEIRRISSVFIETSFLWYDFSQDVKKGLLIQLSFSNVITNNIFCLTQLLFICHLHD